jgi:tRNA 2-thiouridine synthesizing protein D
MKLSLLVLSAPYASGSADTAWHYADAAVTLGHELNRVFFYDEGALNGTLSSIPPQDEDHRTRRWAELKQRSGCELVLCIASALKRGMLDTTEATRYEQPGATIHPAFELGGLGLLVDASAKSERLITFGPG